MELKIEYLPVGELKPYERNARKHSDEDVKAIEASIKEFGFDDPIGIWHDTIVEGHGRLLAAMNLGMETVPVIRLDHLTDEQRRAYALAHNRVAELSSWDKMLKDLEILSINDIDMEQFGFFPEEEKEQKVRPEVEFTEILGEENNYVILQFKTDVDWLYAQSLLDIKPVQAQSTRRDGKITSKMHRYGTGRVLDGVATLRKLVGDE